jgi:hypothetical protein
MMLVLTHYFNKTTEVSFDMTRAPMISNGLLYGPPGGCKSSHSDVSLRSHDHKRLTVGIYMCPKRRILKHTISTS